MTERTRTVEVGGQPVFVREWGEPDAPVALFVHGVGDDGGHAEPLARVLAGTRRMVAPDAPGHGRSPRAQPDAYAPTRVVALLAGLLDELAIASAAVVGFSWGASIGCHLAARHPERVRSLVLLEGGHIDFHDVVDFDPAAIPAGNDLEAAMGRALVGEPVVATYAALRRHSVPVLLVTALRDEAMQQLVVDPLARLEQAVPQTKVARVAARSHDLLASDDGAVVNLVRDWLLAHVAQ
jgi:pimeloyl-ACP methyl ester carboxylesterase